MRALAANENISKQWHQQRRALLRWQHGSGAGGGSAAAESNVSAALWPISSSIGGSIWRLVKRIRRIMLIGIMSQYLKKWPAIK